MPLRISFREHRKKIRSKTRAKEVTKTSKPVPVVKKHGFVEAKSLGEVKKSLYSIYENDIKRRRISRSRIDKLVKRAVEKVKFEFGEKVDEKYLVERVKKEAREMIRRELMNQWISGGKLKFKSDEWKG